MLLKERFDQDKYFLITQTNEFLAGNKHIQTQMKPNRDEVIKAVEEGDFTRALQELETLREDKTGIRLTKIEPLVKIDGATPVIIRDARGAKDPRELGTEGYEMQYLNAVRAAIDITSIENKSELKGQLKQEAISVIKNFHNDNEDKAQAEISIGVKNKVNDIAVFLENNGIKEVHKKLNVAKDFQNLQDEHCNIATISNIKNKDGEDKIVIEAEVALKGITDAQRLEYQNRTDKQWFMKMDSWEKGLVNKYAGTIQEGNHVISTQLRQIVGMKNAFEKITAISNDNAELEIIHNSKHAGTLASISHDNNSRQHITNLNAKQAQEWIGTDHILHTNTLNSGPANIPMPSVHIDIDIVKSTKSAMRIVGGKNTNTAFNKFRKIAAFSDFNGIKAQLIDLTNNLPEDARFNDIATHLRPRGKLEKFFGINKPRGDLETMLNTELNTGRISKQAHEILTNAASLKQDIDNADSIFLRGEDKENISVSISRKLNHLNNKIVNSDPNDQFLNKIPKYETLTMCASGKDRTGLAEHDQSSSAIADKLGIDIKEVDKQLLKSGHTVGQAGGVYAGGATIGCYGTLQVTNEGFPQSRKESLQSIIELTGANNKIKKLKKGEMINEVKEQQMALETPDMYKTITYKTMSTSIQTRSTTIPNIHDPLLELNKSQKQTVQISKPITTVTINHQPLTPTNTPKISNSGKQNKGINI
jgi:hypothetical protein